MHLKHTCLPISPPEQGKKLVCSISYRQRLRKGVKKKTFKPVESTNNFAANQPSMRMCFPLHAYRMRTVNPIGRWIRYAVPSPRTSPYVSPVTPMRFTPLVTSMPSFA